MRWYDSMGETNPSYRSDGLVELRESKLRPQTVRAVLWFASYRIMDEKRFTESDRKQAGVYLETIFGALDSIERQDAEFAPGEKRSVATRLDMDCMMAWASSEVRTATFPRGFDPSRRDQRNEEIRMQLNVGITERHLVTAYQKYLEYQEVQARDSAWLNLKWF